jgi:muconolactone delta-isomerase
VTSFLVEAYTPAAAALSEIEARARLASVELQREGMPVRYVRSILIPGDETCLHLFQGPSAEAVREVSERAGLSAQRIVEAVA